MQSLLVLRDLMPSLPFLLGKLLINAEVGGTPRIRDRQSITQFQLVNGIRCSWSALSQSYSGKAEEAKTSRISSWRRQQMKKETSRRYLWGTKRKCGVTTTEDPVAETQVDWVSLIATDVTWGNYAFARRGESPERGNVRAQSFWIRQLLLHQILAWIARDHVDRGKEII